MAYVRKVRIPEEDEKRIQSCADLLEREVEARDLTQHLYSSKILDFNDKCFIDAGQTESERMKRLLETLIMRGPLVYHELTSALTKEGYYHIVAEMQHDDEVKKEDTLGRVESVLQDIEDIVLRHLESRKNSSKRKREIDELIQHVSERKHDALKEVKILEKEKREKENVIESLTVLMDEKEQKLLRTEQNKLELELKIQNLESLNKKCLEELQSYREMVPRPLTL